MSGRNDTIETTAAEASAQLLHLGFGPDERVSIIIEPVEGVATMGQKSQMCVVVGRFAEGGIGGPIEQPNLAETIRRRLSSLLSHVGT